MGKKIDENNFFCVAKPLACSIVRSPVTLFVQCQSSLETIGINLKLRLCCTVFNFSYASHAPSATLAIHVG